MIITIGREYGSGGHDVGAMLSGKLGIVLYDKENLAENAMRLGYYDEIKGFYEEKPADSLLYVIAKSDENGKMGEKPFKHIKEVTADQSCVIIGRCANYIFRNEEEHISVFIHADMDKRIKRIAQNNNISEKQAKNLICETDKKRAEFHNQYTRENWGDSRGYQLSIDSGMIGIEQTVDLICDYIAAKRQWRQSGK
nr:cytidylate kinase-like family protein [uncultured Aminipila sp.]